MRSTFRALATLRLVCLSLLLSCLPRSSAVLKKHYKTAFFWPIPGTPPTVWKATFEDYLNEVVGAKLNITFEAFPARYPGYRSLESYLDSGEIDFIYAPAVLSECYSAIYQTVPLLTTKKAGNAVMNGGVIFAKDDRDDIVSLADVRDKIVAANLFVSLTSYGMQSQTLARAGVHLLSEAKQVRMFQGVSPVQDVMSGSADIGFAPAPSVSGLPVKILHELELQTPDGIYPFPTSTALIPNTPFSAIFGTDSQVIHEVIEAMLLLNNSHPATIAAKYWGWTHAYSYGAVRNAMEEGGTLRLEEGEWRCYDKPYQLLDFITCPDTSIRKSREEIQDGCTKKGLECPDRATCVCDPCLQAEEVEVHIIRINSTDVYNRCLKMQKCGSAEQTQVFEFKVVDNLRRENKTVEFRLWDRTEGDQTSTNGLAERVFNGSALFEYRFNVTTANTGNILLEIVLGGEQIAKSPVLIGVTSKTCERAGREADELGDCVCKSSTLEIMTECIDRGVLLLSVLLPALFLLALCALGYMHFKLKAAEATWKIDRKHMEIIDPPEVLGSGASGEVVKGKYRGTYVAVKRTHTTGNVTATSSIEMVSLSRIVKNARGIPGFSRTGGSSGGPSSPGKGIVPLPDGAMSPPGKPVSRATVFPVANDANGQNDGNPMLRSMEIDRTDSAPRSQEKLETPLELLTSAAANTSKTASKRQSTASSTKRFIAEVKLLANLRHPSITTMMGAVVDKAGTLLVMELMSIGSLADMCSNDAYIFDGDLVHSMFQNIAEGMDFLHSHEPSIVHADLKAANVLVDQKFHAKVADFGLSKGTNTLRGTPYWMAPELLLGDLPSVKSDVYAFGILLYEIMSRKSPYSGEDPKAVLSAVADPLLQKRPDFPEHTPEEMKVLAKNLLLPAPQLRLSFADIRKKLDTIPPSSYKLTWSMKGKVAKRGDAKQAQQMFHSMFPKHIAEALVRGETPPEDKSDCATVFFSDIVGFTNMSSTLESQQVSDMLDRLFKKYDAIAAECGVYKLETIGDCYIGITNLVTEQPSDHVARMAKFSLLVMQASKETLVDENDPSKGHVNIRIGFECGPVTGNVVGTTNKKYTIFGNTVNTASRMESTGEPGKIQCSENAAQLLRQQDSSFQVELRGEVAVKGRGQMKTFWLKPHLDCL